MKMQMLLIHNGILVHKLVLNPTTPQKAAGCLIEPPVSVPIEASQSFAATAAAEPPLDPPGTFVVQPDLARFRMQNFHLKNPLQIHHNLFCR